MQNENRINFFEVVDFKDGEITVLDSLFKHDDDFMGATGSKFVPVSKEEYEERTSRESIIEYLQNAIDEVPKGFNNMEEWVDAIFEAGEEVEIAFDTSHCEHWDYLRKQTGLDEDEAYIFDCIGGGRCFDANFEGNMNKKINRKIRKYESE